MYRTKHTYKRLDQKGFGLIEGLLVVVVIGLLSAAGWYVWSSRSDDEAPVAQPSASTIEQADNEPTEASSDYLEIKEWGVRVPLSKIGSFAVVPTTSTIYNTPAPGDGTPKDMELLYVDVTGFADKKENQCLEKDGHFIAGQLYRHKEQYPTIQYMGTETFKPAAQVKIGEWWYSTLGLSADGGSSCFSGELPEDYVALAEKFLEDIKNIEAY